MGTEQQKKVRQSTLKLVDTLIKQHGSMNYEILINKLVRVIGEDFVFFDRLLRRFITTREYKIILSEDKKELLTFGDNYEVEP